MKRLSLFCTVVLFLGIFLCEESTATFPQRKLGYKEEEVKTALKSSIFRGDGLPGDLLGKVQSYDPKFRPLPVNSSDSSSRSTKVVVSLRDFRIAGFDWTSVTVGFTAKILLEYFDSRLAYEAPEGVDFIVVSPGDPFFTPVWRPSIRFYAQPSNRSGFHNHPYPIFNRILVTPRGLVQLQSDLGGIRELRSRKPRKHLNEFSLRMSVEETTSEVQLVWNKDLPVTFHSPEFEVELPAQADFDVSSEGIAAFDRSEDGGFLGESQFSCLLFDFSLARKDI